MALIRITTLLFILLFVKLCFAESTPPDIKPTPINPIALESQAPSNNLTFLGYLDTSYNYLLRRNIFISGVDDRYNDITENGFSLQQAAFLLFKTPKQGFGALLNVIAGLDANKLSSSGWNSYYGSEDFAIDLTQLYIQYNWQRFGLMVGKFNSLVGYEYNTSPDDTNFSRSILAGYAQPSTHAGFRARYEVNERLHLLGGLNNGWDSIRQIYRLKTLELGVAYLPSEAISLQIEGYFGSQPQFINGLPPSPATNRGILDIVIILNVTPKLTLAANYDYDLQRDALVIITPAGTPHGNGTAIWQGIASYVNYNWTDKWQTSVRGEVFSDRNGYATGIPQAWKELTLTLTYMPIKALQVRLETRHDFMNVNSVLVGNNGGVCNNQQSYALEAIYSLSRYF